MRKCFSKPLYLTSLRRYWVSGALLSVIFILLVLAYHSSISYLSRNDAWRFPHQVTDSHRAGIALIDQSVIALIAFLITGAAILCAVLVFSYLHNKRGAVMMHAIPVKRETHFISAFLGGLTLLWGPIILGVSGFAVSQASVGAFNGASVGIMLALLLLWSLAAYSFTVLAGFLTGSILGQLSITALLAVLPPLVEFFFHQMLQTYLFGYAGGSMWVNDLIHPVSIFARLTWSARSWLPGGDPGTIPAGDWMGILFLLAYCAAAIAASLLLYRRRRLECAGDFIAVRGMRPVFRYGAALLTAIIFGMTGTEISGHGAAVGVGFSGWLPYSIAGGILGFFIAEMFIRKTVKVHRHWKGALLFTGCYVAVFLALFFDVFGYGSHVLPKDKVESIYLSNQPLPWTGSAEWMVEPLSYMFTGDNIDAALALQELIAKEGRRSTRQWHDRRLKPGEYSESIVVQLPYEASWFHLTATLANGQVVERRYFIMYDKSSAEWRETVAALHKAARPQKIERLRNVGREAQRLEISSYNYIYDWETVYHGRGGSIRGEDISEFIEALILDNRESPNWEEISYYNYNYTYDHYLSPHSFLHIRAVLDDRTYYGAGSITINVYHTDRNAIEWLIEREYIPKEADWFRVAG
jgi:hypothetical protein